MNQWMISAFANALLLSPLIGFGQDGNSPFTAGWNERRGDPRQPLTEDEMVEQGRRELLQEFDAKPSLDHGESVHPRLMETVKDYTTGVRYEEREAYFQVLRLAHGVPLRHLERVATQIRDERRDSDPRYETLRGSEFPQYEDLFLHPEIYRGRPVTLRGMMRKLTKFDVGRNSLDLKQAYEGWVYTSDSQGNPAVVVFTSKDERLPVQGDIQEEVQFTGYFFKMYKYDAQDTTRGVPLILAGEVEWFPHPEKSEYKQIGIEWYAITTFAFLIGLYVFWQMNRREMPIKPPPQVEPDFSHFPPRACPAPDPNLPHSIVETEDS